MDDLISRQAALSTIEKMYKMCEGNLSDYHDLLVACFTDLTPAQRWIPCKERLPDKDGYYLATCERFGWNAEKEVFTDIVEVFRGSWIEPGKVIAWMPLPEPWKGDKE